MLSEDVLNSIFIIGLCLWLPWFYIRCKRLEKDMQNLPKEDIKSVRKILALRQDFAWAATVKLPAFFKYVANFLAVLFLLFVGTGLYFWLRAVARQHL